MGKDHVVDVFFVSKKIPTDPQNIPSGKLT